MRNQPLDGFRSQSSVWGINPDKIVVAGASAGGYLSLCCAMIEKIDDITDDLSISCIPIAMVVFNGGIDADLLIQMFPEWLHSLHHNQFYNHYNLYNE